MSNSVLVSVAAYDDPVVAHLARNRLSCAGIQAFLDGEHHVAMDWLVSNAVGGVKILVPLNDREQAIELLQQSTDSESNTRNQPDGIHRCTNCGSRNTYRVKLNRKLIFLSLLILGIPLPFISRMVICDDCGHRWRKSRIK